jgi:predicted SprT family Zn-dependent metalloprotease
MQFVLEGIAAGTAYLSDNVIRNNNVISAKSVHQEYMEHYVAHLFQSVTSVTDSNILQVD